MAITNWEQSGNLGVFLCGVLSGGAVGFQLRGYRYGVFELSDRGTLLGVGL